MYCYKNGEENNTCFSVKQYQNPTDNDQRIDSECVVEKIAWNIDLLMQRILYPVCIDAEEKHQNDKSEKKVIIFVVCETSVC